MSFRRRRVATPLSVAIWNRAASADPLPPAARPGDRALHDVMQFHGYVMNGGLDHGLDVMGADGAERAAAGWRHLGRRDVADLLREALRTVADMPTEPELRAEFFIDGWTRTRAEAIERLAERYESDDALEQAFLRHLNRHPDDFAPVAR